MKRILTILSLVVIAVVVLAIPAKHGVKKTITLADGTQKTVTLVGDEHLHYFADANGNAYVELNGTYVKADLSEMKKKGIHHRTAAQKHRNARIARQQIIPNGRRNAKKTSQYIGKKKGLIILV